MSKYLVPMETTIKVKHWVTVNAETKMEAETIAEEVTLDYEPEEVISNSLNGPIPEESWIFDTVVHGDAELEDDVDI